MYNEHTMVRLREGSRQVNEGASRTHQKWFKKKPTRFMYANITGPGKGHCPNAVLCNCLESEKLRESHPWTCDNRTVSLASNRPELIHKPVCACCSSKRFGHHRSSSQFLTFQVDTSHPVPEARVRFCCRSTKVGFSGFCCSYGAHLKMYGKQREYRSPLTPWDELEKAKHEGGSSDLSGHIFGHCDSRSGASCRWLGDERLSASSPRRNAW